MMVLYPDLMTWDEIYGNTFKTGSLLITDPRKINVFFFFSHFFFTYVNLNTGYIYLL